MLGFGIVFGLILPPLIYQNQLSEMWRMESGILDDLDRIHKKGKKFKDI